MTEPIVTREDRETQDADNAARWAMDEIRNFAKANCGMSPAVYDALLSRINHADHLHHRARIAAVKAERERILRLDEPWALYRIVERLADAADHLLRDHDCDAHGYEAVNAARDAAREWLTHTWEKS